MAAVEAEVAVVGAGLVGAAFARALGARLGAAAPRVALVDPGLGAGGAGGGGGGGGGGVLRGDGGG